MILTTQQIHAEIASNEERNKIGKLLKEDILRGRYSLSDACKISSAYNYKPAEYGNIIETLTKRELGLCKPPNCSYGDASICNEIGVEIKTSFSDGKGAFTLRQIRFYANIAYYLLVNYDRYNVSCDSKKDIFFEDFEQEINYGAMYYYLVPRKDMQYLVETYGSYTHGTKSNLGKITSDDTQTDGKEFSLDYNRYSKDMKTPNKVWEYLQQFSCSKEEMKIEIAKLERSCNPLVEVN